MPLQEAGRSTIKAERRGNVSFVRFTANQLFMKSLVLSAIAALSLLCACKKPMIHWLSDELDEAVNVSEGSYFIYEEEETHKIDSCVSTGYTRGITGDASDRDRYEIVMYHVAVDSHASLRFTAREDKVLINYNDTGKVYAFGTVMADPFDEDKTITSPYSDYRCTFIKYHEHFKVRDVVYDEVYEAETFSDGKTLHTWYSLRSGLIRYFFKNKGKTSTWNLVKEHVIKRKL